MENLFKFFFTNMKKKLVTTITFFRKYIYIKIPFLSYYYHYSLHHSNALFFIDKIICSYQVENITKRNKKLV
jgi:hypothetical protein